MSSHYPFLKPRQFVMVPPYGRAYGTSGDWAAHHFIFHFKGIRHNGRCTAGVRALTDPAARERFTFVEESLKKRGVKKKVFITDREVRIVNSVDRPDLFTQSELANPIPVLLSFVQRVDENINGTLHGVISELYLDELETANGEFKTNVEKVVSDIVERAQKDPRFSGKDTELLRKQGKKIVFMRTVWKAKHIFYELNTAIRPPYALTWSSDPEDREMNRQLVQFYSNARYEPVDREFAEFVVYQPTPGIELPFFFTPW